MTVTIEKEGRRHYITGDTYPFRGKLKAAGCHWDAGRQAWWTSKRDVAEQLVATCNGLAGGGHAICPPKKYNDLVREKGGVWDRDRKVWLLPTADAKTEIERAIEADQKRAARQREEAKRVEEARKAAARKPVEQLLSEAGRQQRDGKQAGFTRHLGHGRKVEIVHDVPTPGEIMQRKDGPWMLVEVGDVYLITDDDIEDQDAWSSYPNGSGWYVGYEAIPVEPTAGEAAARAEKDAAAARAKRRQEIEGVVRHIDHYKPASTTGLARLWGDSRMAGSETMYGDATRLVYVVSSYDDGPHVWELVDQTLAAEALALKVEGK
jgi:hypothetical protein